MQTRFSVPLPMRPPAFSRAVKTGAVVTALVRLPRLGQARRIGALVVSTPDYLVPGVRTEEAIRVLVRIEGHPPVPQVPAP